MKKHEAKKLYKEGHSIKTISIMLNLNWETAKFYCTGKEIIKRLHRKVDKDVPAGCFNVTDLPCWLTGMDG